MVFHCHYYNRCLWIYWISHRTEKSCRVSLRIFGPSRVDGFDWDEQDGMGIAFTTGLVCPWRLGLGLSYGVRSCPQTKLGSSAMCAL